MEEVAGWITFKTKIDDKYFETGIKKAQRDLEKIDKENEKLTDKKREIEVKYKVDKENLDKEFEDTKNKLLNEYNEQMKIVGKAGRTSLTPKLQSEFDSRAVNLVEEYNKKLEEISRKKSDIGKKIDDNNKKREDTKRGLENLIKKYEEFRSKQKDDENGRDEKKKTDDVGKSLDKVSKKMSGIIKKVGRWAMALIGIRSIYGLLSNAAARLDQTNKQTKKDLDYMKTALATGLEPIITWIVNMAMKLLQIFNTLVYQLTGKNLFKDAKKNLESGAKSAKSINKSLAGFDEMNVLSDNSGSGGGGAVTPSLDLGKTIDLGDLWENLKVQLENIWNKFISWLEDTNWQEAGMNVYLHIKKWFTEIKWGDILANLVEGIGGLFGALAAAIGGFFAGVWLDIKNYFADWIEKSREQGGNIIDGLLAGILNAIAQIGIWIYEHILKPFITGFKKAFGISSPSKVMIEMGGYLIDGLKDGLKNIWDKVKGIFDNLKTKIIGVFTSIKDKITDVWKTVKSYIVDKVITPISKKFDEFKDKISKIVNGIKETAVKVINKIIEAMNKLIKGLNKISFDVPSWVPGLGGKKWGFDLKEIPTVKLQKGGIVNLPGKGVPLAGEKSPEGVIPLTDAEQMAILGESIGKYVTISLTNITKLDSREISRINELIKSNRDFIMNR